MPRINYQDDKVVSFWVEEHPVVKRLRQFGRVELVASTVDGMVYYTLYLDEEYNPSQIEKEMEDVQGDW